MTKQLKDQLIRDWRHYIIRYPGDEESQIISLMCIKDYKTLTEAEIRAIIQENSHK
jgi:hypothetical protein